jgi:dTDP-4-dehydrorhamnose 3,5-epimerase
MLSYVMKFIAEKTSIDGCVLIKAQVAADARGTFTKVFHLPDFTQLGLNCTYREEYVTHSLHGVLRGLHFQLPPMDVDKIVYCVSGEALDVVVDLRLGSPTYGKHEVLQLNASSGHMVYIPTGLAHGFFVTGKHATLVYKVSKVYSPEHDTGVLWNSCGIPWPAAEPILSARDKSFAPLHAFASPFVYYPGQPKKV